MVSEAITVKKKSILIYEKTYMDMQLVHIEERRNKKTDITTMSKWIENELLTPFLKINKLTGLNMRQLLAVVKSDKFKKLTLELESELAA